MLSLILRYLRLVNVTYCKSDFFQYATTAQLSVFTAIEGRELPPTPPENFALEVAASCRVFLSFENSRRMPLIQ